MGHNGHYANEVDAKGLEDPSGYNSANFILHLVLLYCESLEFFLLVDITLSNKKNFFLKSNFCSFCYRMKCIDERVLLFRLLWLFLIPSRKRGCNLFYRLDRSRGFALTSIDLDVSPA
jgi:hypothetical protein